MTSNTQTMKTSQKLTVSDLITIGIFTAIYFVLVTIATFGTAIIIPGLSMCLLPAVCGLISGCVYMLLTAKVQKFGAITIMGFVLGAFFFVSGHFPLSFVPSIVFSILADLIARSAAYKSRIRTLISYVVFCYGITGPVLPLYFMKDAYIENLIARGKDNAYITDLFAQISAQTFIFCVLIATLVLSAAGGLFGQKMMKKHFKKAGII